MHRQNSRDALKIYDLAGPAEIRDKEMKNYSRDKLGSWAVKTECGEGSELLHLGCSSFPLSLLKERLIPQREHFKNPICEQCPSVWEYTFIILTISSL